MKWEIVEGLMEARLKKEPRKAFLKWFPCWEEWEMVWKEFVKTPPWEGSPIGMGKRANGRT